MYGSVLYKWVEILLFTQRSIEWDGAKFGCVLISVHFYCRWVKMPVIMSTKNVIDRPHNIYQWKRIHIHQSTTTHSIPTRRCLHTILSVVVQLVLFFSLSLASTASFRMLKLTHSIISNTKCCAWHLIKTIYVAHPNWRASELLPMEFIGNLWWNQQWNWKCSKNRFRVFATHTTSAFVYLRFYQHN